MPAHIQEQKIAKLIHQSIFSFILSCFYIKQLICQMSKKSNPREESLVVVLEDLLKQIQCSSSSSFIFKLYRAFSVKVTKLFKYFQHHLVRKQLSINLTQKLSSLIAYLKSIVISLEYEKYGQLFPFFFQIVKNYETLVSEKVQNLAQKQLPKSIQRSSFNKNLKELTIIKTATLHNLKSNDFQNFFGQVLEQKKSIQDSQCICCTTTLIKNEQISNKNPQIPNVVCLTYKQSCQQYNLQKYLCALCNQNGGVLIIGGQKKNDVNLAKGIKYKDLNQIKKMQSLIIQAINSIKPEITNYSISKVKVEEKPYLQNSINPENNRFCYRISIFPNNQSKISYLQFHVQYHPSSYEVYRFDSESKVQKLISCKQDSVYTYIHNNITNKVKYKNSHQGIYCYQQKQLLNPSKLNSNEINFNKYAGLEQSSSSDSQSSDEPKFKYSNTSILILRSSKYDRYIQEYTIAMNKAKIKHEIVKPFHRSFKNIPRPIWMLSFQANPLKVKQILKKIQINSSLKQGDILIMPVTKILKIEKSKVNEQQKKIIQDSFQLRFKNIFQTEIMMLADNKGQQKNHNVYEFDNYNQGIFGYLLFQSLQLKPYFIKEKPASSMTNLTLNSNYSY